MNICEYRINYWVYLPGIARPAPGGTCGKQINYKKSVAYKKVLEMQKQWSVEVGKCINEWANGGWDANEMTEPMNTKLMNQWIHKWMHESLAVWMNGWGWMSEQLLCWAPSALGNIFAEVFYFFSLSLLFGLLLLWRCPERSSTYLFCSFCNTSVLFVQLLQCV